ncbi:septal ring lytic transglycosylase RlpA family protein [Hydrogenophaga soli]
MSKPGRALATAWLLAGALSGAWGQVERPVSVEVAGEPSQSSGAAPVSAEDGALPEGPLPSLNDNRPAPPPEPLFTLIETGLASWYHPSFAGRRMANGQPYRPGDFTAAHKTLPLDSHARVVNLSTGVDVVVRITDRGPHVAGRVVDLSQAAARELGLLGLGVTLVEVHSATPEDWAEFVARQPGVNSALHDRPLRVPTNPKRR